MRSRRIDAVSARADDVSGQSVSARQRRDAAAARRRADGCFIINKFAMEVRGLALVEVDVGSSL